MRKTQWGLRIMECIWPFGFWVYVENPKKIIREKKKKGLSKPTNQMSLSQNAKIKKRVQRQSKRILMLVLVLGLYSSVCIRCLTDISFFSFTFTFMVFVFGLFSSYIIPFFGFSIFISLIISYQNYVSLHLTFSDLHTLPTICSITLLFLTYNYYILWQNGLCLSMMDTIF